MKERSYLSRNKTRLAVLTVIIALLIFAVTFGSDMFLKSRLPIKYGEQVEKYSEKYGVDKYLVYAVISAESGFDKDAHSGAGACGLMQLMPETAEWMSRKFGTQSGELTDPDVNIENGCCYIADLIDRFGTEELALAAYNGGEGNVRQWQEKYSSNGRDLDYIPFKETREYVKRVTVRHGIYKDLYS